MHAFPHQPHQSGGDDHYCDEEDEISPQYRFAYDLTDVDFALLLRAFYCDVNPEKMSDVDLILSTYRGEELLMLQQLSERYEVPESDLQNYISKGRRRDSQPPLDSAITTPSQTRESSLARLLASQMDAMRQELKRTQDALEQVSRDRDAVFGLLSQLAAPQSNFYAAKHRDDSTVVGLLEVGGTFSFGRGALSRALGMGIQEAMSTKTKKAFDASASASSSPLESTKGFIGIERDAEQLPNPNSGDVSFGRARPKDTLKPIEVVGSLDGGHYNPALPNDEWIECFDPASQQKYFYNSVTATSEWTLPAGVVPVAIMTRDGVHVIETETDAPLHERVPYASEAELPPFASPHSAFRRAVYSPLPPGGRRESSVANGRAARNYPYGTKGSLGFVDGPSTLLSREASYARSSNLRPRETPSSPLKSAKGMTLLEDAWVMAVSGNGRRYWYNKHTRQSTYRRPADCI